MTWTPPSLPPRFEASRRVPLVGRDSELKSMESVWASVESGSRQLVLLGGEPGAGKTRLAAEIAGALVQSGVTVLVGNSRSEGGAPYEPFREMLDQLFAANSGESLVGLLDGRFGRELRRLSPEVARYFADEQESASVETEARQELFEAVATFFRKLSQERPLTLIVEDLHWSHSSTIGLLEHVVRRCSDVPMLVIGSFRTTPPDRSDELSSRLAELHRLEGVRRFDLEGLDTEAIARYINIKGKVPMEAARSSAAILRDRTGGNPFFLREVWIDLEQRGGVAALRFPQRVPASIGDTLARRLAGLSEELRQTIDLAAVLGDTFHLRVLLAASDANPTRTMAAVDSAAALGLIETVEGRDDEYSFVHSLTRQSVLDRMAPSRVKILNARAAEALEELGSDPALVPRLANHYLTAQVLGYEAKALHYARRAGEIAERSVAYEEAARWFERASTTPGIEEDARAELVASAALNHLRAGYFARARELYDRLANFADPQVRLDAAMGYEDANWRPGLADTHAADLMTSAIESSDLDESDPRHAKALGSLGRALAFAGETERARQVGDRAIDLARRIGDPTAISHTLKTSLWHGLTPDMSDVQLGRAAELAARSKESGSGEDLGAASYFRAMAAYMCGDLAHLEEAADDCRRAAQTSGQAFFHYVDACVAQGVAFMRGDFEGARRWARRALNTGSSFGADTTEGSFGVQMYMIHRETRTLPEVRHHFDGQESFHGKWVPGLLALYTELEVEAGARRALRHLLNRELSTHTTEAQWPIELVFMTEAALLLHDQEALASLEPFLEEFAGQNIVGGQFVAVFGSADHYLARVAAINGDKVLAEKRFVSAAEMSRKMGSVVHTAETLAHHARHLAAFGEKQRSAQLAAEARQLASAIGQGRVLRLVDQLEIHAGPGGLTEREVEVLRLMADGFSNKEIGEKLFISSHTAANHVRSILTKTGATNRTQAAMYAAEHHLL